MKNFFKNLTKKPEINIDKLAMCQRIFYLFLALIIYLHITRIGFYDVISFQPQWPIFYLEYFGEYTRRTIFLVSCIVSILLCFIAVENPFDRILKSIIAILIFLITSYSWSFGWTDHSYLFPLYAAIGFSVVGKNNKKNWNILIFGIQLFFLLPYLCAGLWKLRYGIDFIFTEGFSEFKPLEVSYIRNLVSTASVGVQFPHFSFLLSKWFWFFGVLFELFIISIAFIPKFQRYGGYSIFLFHFSIFLMFENFIYFTPVLIAIPLFILGPYSRSVEGV
ncbi:MAG: hypothetical protein M9962_04385 [Oligoflexia bacterium]|nr:hypothetical protein [Oligoflexia bacterium]